MSFTTPAEFARLGDLHNRVDRLDRMVAQHADPLKFGAMRQVTPIGRFAAQKEGQPADAVVRVGVGQDDGGFGPALELTYSQRRADAGIAATDDQNVHGGPPSCELRRLGYSRAAWDEHLRITQTASLRFTRASSFSTLSLRSE